MRAVTFQGTKDIQVKNVADPILQKKDDIIVRITSTAICGSDLHIYQGALPTEIDYVIGHEPMGIVEDVGPEVTRVKKGDRVVLPFNISYGHCFYCKHDMESQCDHSNPNPKVDTGGYFGFTERYGSEVYNFNDFDDMGAHIKEITNGGVGVVVDCVGMDGKKSVVEKVEQKLKITCRCFLIRS